METQSRIGEFPAPHAQTSLFSAGLMLILNVWRVRDTGHALAEERRDIDAVFTCIKVLKTYEDRWHAAGRYCDILMALISVGKSSPESPPATRSKRHCSAIEGEMDIPYNEGNPTSVWMQASKATTSSAGESSSSNHGADSAHVPFAAYGSDLSGTFARLNKLEFDQAMSSYSRDPASSGSSAPLLSQDTLFSQMFTTGNPAALYDSPVWPADGSAPGIQPSLPSAYFPTQESELYLGSDSVVDNQGSAALWTGMPMGYDIDDWERYLLDMDVPSSSQQCSDSLQNSDIFSFDSIVQ
ncbi:hypothetical protein MD484_g555, partial [Candolleomyces efflorescens]